MVRAFRLGALVHRHDLRGLRRAFDEEDGGQDHADFHRHRQVNDDRQAERREKDGGIAEGPFGQAAEIVPFAHVQCHVDQHRAECGQRDELRQRRRGKNDDQQRERVNHARDGRARAALDVGGGAGDGAGGGDAPEERADDVGQTLCHQLLIRVVPVVHHAVGDDGTKQ